MVQKRKSFHKEIDILINKSADFLANGNFSDAYSSLDSALTLDYSHARVLKGLEYIKFWKDRVKALEEQSISIEQAESLLHFWKKFRIFTTAPEKDLQLIQSLRCYVFSRLLDLISQFTSDENIQKKELWYGIAFKGIGNYDDALAHFSKAMQKSISSARILSELADTYAIIGEDNKAKVLCREAFFLDPQDVDIDYFESEFLIRLVENVRKVVGTDVELIKEWIPIYGSLWGVLNVTRELKAVEYGRLRQQIFNFEQELKMKTKSKTLLPRLLNHYFWLVDHLLKNNEDQSKIDDVLLKLKSISPEIHKLYTN